MISKSNQRIANKTLTDREYLKNTENLMGLPRLFLLIQQKYSFFKPKYYRSYHFPKNKNIALLLIRKRSVLLQRQKANNL